MSKNGGEESLIDTLYKETIEIYKKKKGFAFLILLFLKIYRKKDLCTKLLKIFKEINENPKENEKNMDRKPFLKDYTSKFKEIESEADELLKNYDSKEFYGIILSYLNFYDYENFISITDKLLEDTPEVVYEILIIYKDNFKYPIKQNLDFFIKFISYIIEKKDEKKDEKKSEKKKRDYLENGLNYIKDLETFLSVVEEKKEDIYNKYNSKKIEKIIKLDELKFNKIEIDDMTKKGPDTSNTISLKTPETEKQDTEEINPLIIKKKKRA